MSKTKVIIDFSIPSGKTCKNCRMLCGRTPRGNPYNYYPSDTYLQAICGMYNKELKSVCIKTYKTSVVMRVFSAYKCTDCLNYYGGGNV